MPNLKMNEYSFIYQSPCIPVKYKKSVVDYLITLYFYD